MTPFFDGQARPTAARGARHRLWGVWGACVVAVLFALFPTHPALGQQQVVSGTVIDARTLRPLSRVQVRVEGADFGAVTDSDGNFRIVGTLAGQINIIVTRIGYRPVTQQLAVGTTGNRILLTESALSLDEIVVTGTVGQETARSISNAVGRVRAEEVEVRAPSRDVQSMISAEVPGVRIMSTGGEVGTGGTMRIRGVSSLSISATPLVYVDGVRVNGLDNELASGTGFASGEGSSRINDFNADDIESIEIIKGPAAATLYGTEASNGVIQIITKRGREGRPTVNFHVKQGVAFLPDVFNLWNPTYYKTAAGEIREFNVLQNDLDRFGNSWFQTGHTQSYGADVSGGSEFVQYYLSMDWDRDEGAVSYNWRNALSGRANISYTPKQNFGVNFSLGVVRARAQSSSAQQPLSTAIIWSCPAPGCEEGTGLASAQDGASRGYIAYLPEAYQNEIEGFEDVDRTTFSVQANHDPLSWLSHRFTVGADFGTTLASELYRATGNRGNFANFGRKDIRPTRNTLVTADYSATGRVNPMPDLNLATTGGLQFYRRQQQTSFSRGEFFPVVALETVSSGSNRTADEDFFENRTFGVFVQQQVAWKDRIFLTGAIRGDDNSAFGQNFDFVMYPKLGASWVLTDEPVFADSPILSQLKLRAAWGKAGQQPDLFAAIRTYEPTVGENDVAVLTPENIGNPDLEPEVGEEIELGFDAGVLDDRVGLEFTYYKQTSTNAIVRVPTTPSEGFPGFQFRNIGGTSNRGFEVRLSASALQAENVGLDLTFTYATAKNRVEDVGGGAPISIGGFQHHVPGFPIAGLFRKRVVSADLDDSSGRNEAVNVMCEGGTVEPNTPNLSHGGGAPVPCDVAPEVYWGQPVPEWEGSVGAALTLFRNLEVYGLVDYLGGRLMRSGDIDASHWSFGNSKAILERTDPILLGYQSLGAADGRPQSGLINAGFAKLRNVSVTYRFPQTWAAKFGASRMSLSVAGQNLATLWTGQKESFGVKQTDPEVGSNNGQALSAYNQEGWPQLRRFIMSLRITL